MKRVKLAIGLLLVLSLALVLSLPSATMAEDKPKICYNNFGQANFFARIGRTVGINTIKMLGGEPISTVTANVPDRIKAIENCIAQGGEAIIIQEGDIKMAEPALKEAAKKGIVIGSMDAGIAPFVDVLVESNNWVMGAKAASELLVRMGGEGNIVLIHNPIGQMIRMRTQELKAVLTEYPDAKIEASFVYAWPDFFPDIKSKMESVLEAHPEPGSIKGVFATFDGAGAAAASAIREAERQDEIFIVGIDGDPQAYEEMSKPDSPFVATVAQEPWTIAKMVVEKVFKLLKGETLVKKHFFAPSELVTKEKLPPKSEWPYPETYENYPLEEK